MLNGEMKFCQRHRGPSDEEPPHELLDHPPHFVAQDLWKCSTVIFCGGVTGDGYCAYAETIQGRPAGVTNTLCELPYKEPPADAPPPPDTSRGTAYAKSTASCSNLPYPLNTKIPNMLTKAAGTSQNNDNFVISCKRPKDVTAYSNIVSKLQTRTIPAGTESIVLNFHYFCGRASLENINL
jgi:hypothetical protein